MGIYDLQLGNDEDLRVEGGRIREELVRVLASPGFVRSPRMCQFLELIVGNSLSGNDPLKETAIGAQVFGRARDYDSGADPIVRVEARRLRQKLQQYYEGEGASDPVVIHLPKGGYTPEFEIRAANAGMAEPSAEVPADWRARPWRYVWPIAVAACLTASILIAWHRPSRRSGSPPAAITPEAWDAYLKGRYFWNKRSEDGLRKSIGYFREAAQKAPGYAPAWAGLADSWLLLGEAWLRPNAEAFAQAESAVDKALALDDDLGEAHASRAALENNRGQWEQAEAEFRRALELSPGYATAHQWYAEGLASHGRTGEALVEMRRALDLDPLSLTINVQVGYILFLARRYDEAMGQLLAAIEMDSNFWLAHADLGVVYEQKRMYPEAIRELQKSVDLTHGSASQKLWLAQAWALAGRQPEARRARADLEQAYAEGRLDATSMALLDIALGEPRRALARLERACSAHTLRRLSPSPLFDPLHADARIAAMLAGCGNP
jgi:tetratricopeptide (TPR) repeat protein